jgi:ABC-2 type transport system ATP-binding protein
MLTTLLRPTAGSAEVFGFSVKNQANEVRRIVGVVPQEYTADEDLTGSDNIMLTAHLYGIRNNIAKTRAGELLELVGLEEAADRKVSTYSGGMRRRLELACGLINRPRLLFLDEPTLGLDVQTRTAVWDYIRKLKEEYEITLFMTTHYLEEADSLCDRIAIIDRGRIVKIGTPVELKAGIGGDVIEISIKEGQTDITELISRTKGITEVKRNGSNYRVKAPVGEEAAPAIIDAIRTEGFHVSRISLSKPSMDQVYLEYTGKEMRDENVNSVQMMSQRITMRRARS